MVRAVVKAMGCVRVWWVGRRRRGRCKGRWWQAGTVSAGAVDRAAAARRGGGLGGGGGGGGVGGGGDGGAARRIGRVRVGRIGRRWCSG